jgi:hypothetical protein
MPGPATAAGDWAGRRTWWRMTEPRPSEVSASDPAALEYVPMGGKSARIRTMLDPHRFAPGRTAPAPFQSFAADGRPESPRPIMLSMVSMARRFV